MHGITSHVRRNLVAYLALLVALTGTSAYAAGNVFSGDIVNGQVKTQDLAPHAVTASRLAGATPTVASRRTAVPAGVGSGQLVLDVPGFGQVRNKNCSVKSARSSFFNDTAKSVTVFTDASGAGPSTDPLFAKLAPGQEAMGTEVEGLERVIYQAGLGSKSVATVVVMSRPNGANCLYQAEAIIRD